MQTSCPIFSKNHLSRHLPQLRFRVCSSCQHFVTSLPMTSAYPLYHDNRSGLVPASGHDVVPAWSETTKPVSITTPTNLIYRYAMNRVLFSSRTIPLPLHPLHAVWLRPYHGNADIVPSPILPWYRFPASVVFHHFAQYIIKSRPEQCSQRALLAADLE